MIATVISVAALVSCGAREVTIASIDAPFTGAIIYDGDSEEAKNAANAFRLRLNSLGLSSVRGAYSASTISEELEIIFGETDRAVSLDAVRL